MGMGSYQNVCFIVAAKHCGLSPLSFCSMMSGEKVATVVALVLMLRMTLHDQDNLKMDGVTDLLDCHCEQSCKNSQPRLDKDFNSLF